MVLLSEAPGADAALRGGTDRFNEKREAILAAAAQAFNQQGVAGTTLADVAARVGLLKAGIHYYWRRKEDLAADALRRSIDALSDIVAAAGAAGSPPQRIRRLVHGVAALHAAIAAGERAPLVGFSDIRALAAPAGPAVIDAYVALFARLRHLLPTPPGLGRAGRNARAHLLLSLLNVLPVWLARYHPRDHALVAAGMTDLLLGGLVAGDVAPLQAALHDHDGAADAHTDDGLAAPHDPALLPVREAYLRAATSLINEIGHRGASVSRIAARLKLTKGSFYHHHDGKDDLLVQCFERTLAVIDAVHARAARRHGDGLSRTAAATAALVCFQMSDQGPLLRHTALTALQPTQREGIRRALAQRHERLALWLSDGIADGNVRPVHAGLASHLLGTAVNAASELPWWAPGLDRADAPRLYIHPLFHGLLADDR
ncbi:MAG: TetR/AcrR family transcriptional regulator [Aquabacterium sp.]